MYEDSVFLAPFVLSYPEICWIFPPIIKNGSLINETLLFSNPHLGLYGKQPRHGKSIKFISFNHPSIVMAKVKHVISAGFGGVMISNILHEDFNNECGHGYLPMMNAISQSIEIINESEKGDHSIQNKPSRKQSNEGESFDSFMERGGVVLKSCFALLLLGVVSHIVYWLIYFYRYKNRMVLRKPPRRNN